MAIYFPKTNADGSKTSICLKCFLTIGANSDDLARSEREHVCYANDTPPQLHDIWQITVLSPN